MPMSVFIICVLLNFVPAFSQFPFVISERVPGVHRYHGVHDGREHARQFVNEWTVSVDGGAEVAQLVAVELGYIYGGPIPGFPNTYTFLKYEHEKQRRAPSTNTSTLVKDRRIRWAEQLFVKSRVKRYYTPDPDQPVKRVKRVQDNSTAANVTQVIEYSPEPRNVAPDREELSKNEEGGIPDLEFPSKTILRRTKRAEVRRKLLFNDELWGHEWYLQDTRTARSLPRLDLNVVPVYAMGFNGAGVRVCVLDDGVEHNHTDLRDNYDPEISWDCNDNDPDPQPRYEKLNKNSHGTRCAGEIAMTANNKKCGVGVAWGARVGGVRMLDGRITDRVEGEAIGHAWDKVDIYSASWGPGDDGTTVEGPGRLANEAFKRGITKGRGGKGIIYVWANGNGGGSRDNCNCDGYSSSIYTISIGSASQHGLFPWYGEICSSTLAAAYSSGAYKDQKIATTDTGDKCTLSHTGTSAAAPLAAGIVALALHANPNLTWRDVQHLIVWTSEYAPLSANPGWQENGIGLRFDVRFGFGLMNAAALVSAALNWTTVPAKFECHVEASPVEDGEGHLSSGETVDIPIKIDDCVVNYIEHVELITNIRYNRRGALAIYLTSPQGTKVQLLSERVKDASSNGFVNWPLTSVATWGETPHGIWKVTVQDQTNEQNSGGVGSLGLVIHGTNEMPAHMRNGRRKYTHDGNYQEVFDYFHGMPESEISDDNNVANAPEEHGTEEVNVNNIDPTILAEVEKELQRIHHRLAYNRNIGI